MKWGALCIVAYSVIVVGACTPPPVSMEPQEWLRAPTPRPNLMDIEGRVDGLSPTPMKRRSPVFPVTWPPQSDDLQIFLFSVDEPGENGADWTVYTPSHRVQLEVMGDLETILGLAADAAPVGTEARDPRQSLSRMADAEKALVDVAAGRKTSEEALSSLVLYLDWVDATPHRQAFYPSQCPAFFSWLRASR